MLVETSTDPELKKARVLSKERYNKVIQAFNRPFPNHFNTELIEPNFDEEDRTIRCTNCFWEIQASDTVCPHCDRPLGHFDYLSFMSDFEDDEEEEDEDEDERDLELDEYDASWDDFVVDDDEEIELDADDTWNSFEGSPADHPEGPVVPLLDSINEHSDTDDYMHSGSFHDYFEQPLPRVRPIPRNMGFVSASQVMGRALESSGWRDGGSVRELSTGRRSSQRESTGFTQRPPRESTDVDQQPPRETIGVNQRRELRRRARTIESSDDDEEEGNVDTVPTESGLDSPRRGVGQSTSERRSGSENLRQPVAAIDTESSLHTQGSFALHTPSSVANPTPSTISQPHSQSPQPRSDNGSNDSSPFLNDNQSVQNEMGGLPYPLLQSLSLWENHYGDTSGAEPTGKK